MRDRVVEFAAEPTKEEAIAAVELALAAWGPANGTPAQIAEDVRAERR